MRDRRRGCLNRRGLMGGLMAALAFLAVTWLESRRPLRAPDREAKSTRLPRNLTIGALGAIAVSLAERPVSEPLAAAVERRRWGLLHRWNLPRSLHTLLAVALLDYTLYAWHVLTHRVPWLWRFHLVHHVDLDLDATTALRFHFGELLASVPWRAAQIAAIGVTPSALHVWQRWLLASIVFHHSNLELPVPLERMLARAIVTPRLHGIHHSIVRREVGSNLSSGLTIWDRLHGTLRLNVSQADITIGVAAYREPADVTLVRSLELPFHGQREWQKLPDDGEPRRSDSPVPAHILLP